MTKKELIDAIKAKGSEVNERLTKDELQVIYDGLHVHSLPDETPAPPETTEQPEPAEQPETTEQPENPEKPEGTETETDEFANLADKISGATAPPLTEKKKRAVVEKTRRKKKKGESDPDSFRIEGYVLLLIVDTVFPFSFAFLNNMLDKRLKVQANDLQLNDKDFSKLEPLADQAADYMAINLNPIAGFLMISTFMYGNNLLNVRFAMEANVEKK
jgi:hypothetical protein